MCVYVYVCSVYPLDEFDPFIIITFFVSLFNFWVKGYLLWNIASLLLLLLSRFSRVRLCATPWRHPTGSLVPGILQERILEWIAIFSNAWKWKWSHSVVSDSLRPHGLQPTRLFRDFPGKSTGVGCQCLLHIASEALFWFPFAWNIPSFWACMYN